MGFERVQEDKNPLNLKLGFKLNGFSLFCLIYLTVVVKAGYELKREDFIVEQYINGVKTVGFNENFYEYGASKEENKPSQLRVGPFALLDGVEYKLVSNHPNVTVD